MLVLCFQEFIKTIIKGGNSWIGLTDREQEGSWLWVNGAQLKERWERDESCLSLAECHGFLLQCRNVYAVVRKHQNCDESFMFPGTNYS